MSVDPKQPADTAAPFDPASAGWQRHAVDGFLDLVGPIWERPSGDSYRYAFLAEPKHHSRRGHVQGGMLTTFADRAMGRTCWYANERQPQTTVQLDMHFVDAVRVGDFVEAKCTVVRRIRISSKLGSRVDNATTTLTNKRTCEARHPLAPVRHLESVFEFVAQRLQGALLGGNPPKYGC